MKGLISIAIGVIQPFVWYVIYNALYQSAVKNSTADGLAFGCIATGLCATLFFVVWGLNKSLPPDKKRDADSEDLN